MQPSVSGATTAATAACTTEPSRSASRDAKRIPRAARGSARASVRSTGRWQADADVAIVSPPMAASSGDFTGSAVSMDAMDTAPATSGIGMFGLSGAFGGFAAARASRAAPASGVTSEEAATSSSQAIEVLRGWALRQAAISPRTINVSTATPLPWTTPHAYLRRKITAETTSGRLDLCQRQPVAPTVTVAATSGRLALRQPVTQTVTAATSSGRLALCQTAMDSYPITPRGGTMANARGVGTASPKRRRPRAEPIALKATTSTAVEGMSAGSDAPPMSKRLRRQHERVASSATTSTEQPAAGDAVAEKWTGTITPSSRSSIWKRLDAAETTTPTSRMERTNGATRTSPSPTCDRRNAVRGQKVSETATGSAATRTSRLSTPTAGTRVLRGAKVSKGDVAQAASGGSEAQDETTIKAVTASSPIFVAEPINGRRSVTTTVATAAVAAAGVNVAAMELPAAGVSGLLKSEPTYSLPISTSSFNGHEAASSGSQPHTALDGDSLPSGSIGATDKPRARRRTANASGAATQASASLPTAAHTASSPTAHSNDSGRELAAASGRWQAGSDEASLGKATLKGRMHRRVTSHSDVISEQSIPAPSVAAPPAAPSPTAKAKQGKDTSAAAVLKPVTSSGPTGASLNGVTQANAADSGTPSPTSTVSRAKSASFGERTGRRLGQQQQQQQPPSPTTTPSHGRSERPPGLRRRPPGPRYDPDFFAGGVLDAMISRRARRRSAVPASDAK